MHSVEERAELEEHRAYQENALKEALTSWFEAQSYAIGAAASRFISQSSRDCGAYNARQSEKSFVERKREQEAFEREWEKDYIAAAKEHERFLTDEAFKEALKPQPIPQRIRYEHTHILGPSGSGKTSLIQQLMVINLGLDAKQSNLSEGRNARIESGY